MINEKNLLFKLLFLCFFFIYQEARTQQWGDYTLYSVQGSNNAYLLDTNGTSVKTWTFNSSPTGYSCYLLPGGTLVRTVRHSPNSFSGGGQTGKVQKVDWNGNLIWDYVY